LIGRLHHLVFALEVDPKLESKCVFIVGSWDFRVKNASTSGHPLQITRTDLSLVPFEVLVVEVALLQVCNSFEPTMRMVREASWQPNFEIVQHEEGIQIFEILITDNPDDLGSLALVDPLRLEDE
jgi:hypothetical protein